MRTRQRRRRRRARLERQRRRRRRLGGFLYDIERFAALGVRVVAATDDGTEGFHGNALEALKQGWETGEIPEDCKLYACGPDPMLHATERLARERGLECWLSLEDLMGCGVGICNGCPVPTLPRSRSCLHAHAAQRCACQRES